MSSWNLHFHEKDKQQTGEQTDKTVGYCLKYCEGNKEHSDKERQAMEEGGEAALGRVVREVHPPPCMCLVLTAFLGNRLSRN